VNPDFKFKQFSVWHDQCAMKVGTDAVLLGAWVNLSQAKDILDVGTGCGIIALMCAQRSTANIDALEIDANAAEQAGENFRKTVWSSRIKAYNDSFINFTSSCSHQYDLVIANPPYFRNALKPANRSRSKARHDEQLNYESLVFGAARILKHAGKLAVILPSDDVPRFTGIAWTSGLYPIRQTFIIPSKGEKHIRCMAEYSTNPANHCEISELSIREPDCHLFTKEYVELTRDFYLNF
jgi:tRNA1Val (adenine37-N6)-methyltransferase